MESPSRRPALGRLLTALIGVLLVWSYNAPAEPSAGSPPQPEDDDRAKSRNEHGSAASAERHDRRETAPAPRLAEATEADAAAPVVFAGVVLDRDGALASGGVMALVPGLPAIESPVSAEGRFRMMLPRQCRPGSFVRTQVSDSGGILFAGLVKASENAIIHVVASRHEAVTGTVYLPHNDRTDPWYISLSHRSGGERSALGADDGDHSGKIAEVRWTRLDKACRRLEGPVDLLVLPMKPRLSALGHRRFASFDEFRAALQSEVTIEAPKRFLEVRVPSGFGPVREVRLLSLENESATYFAVSENDAYSVSIPAGHYLVSADSASKRRCSARLVVAMHEPWLAVALADELPGPRSLSMTLTDAANSPVANSYFALRASDDQGLRHALLSPPTDTMGAVAVGGLLGARYDVFLHVGRRMEHVGLADLAADDQHLDVSVAARSIVQIDIGRDHSVEQVEFASSRLWSKAAAGTWRQQSARDAVLLGNAIELRESPALVAMQCGEWAGCESWSAGATRMTIPLSRLARLEGQVVEGSARSPASGLAVEVCDALLGGPVLPTWGTTRTDMQGRFSIQVPARLLASAVLVWRSTTDNRVVATQACSSFEPGRPRLVAVP